MNNNQRFTASLHTHVRSLQDAHIDANDLCQRIKELGGKGCAITDHGVLSAIEDYRPVFKANDLKMIPGCELYVDGGILGRLHFIVLAANDNGYKGISKIVTESNRHLDRGFPVISQDTLLTMLAEYKGDIIALSACMQGILSAIFLQNESTKVKIDKLRDKQGSYLSPVSSEVMAAVKEAEDAENALNIATIQRDETKRTAEQRFARREREVSKLEKTEAENAAALRAELENDKQEALKAAAMLDDVKKEFEAAKKRVSAANKALKAAHESSEKYLSYEEKIADLQKELKSEEELHNIAKDTAEAYRRALGSENFYAEIQYHGIPDEADCFPKVAVLAREMDIPIVATNDVHILYGSEDDRLKRQILRSMRNGGKAFMDEGVGDSELYLKDNNELADKLSEILPADVIEEGIRNIDVIFNRCNVEFVTGKHYPKYSKEQDANALLEEAIEEGIKQRFPEGMDKEHEARLKYELPIIESMGYADYHLIVKDFLEYGRLLGYVPEERLEAAPLTIECLKTYIQENGWKNQGFMIGPGRGSAVGSLVCYLLGITALDPLKYGLLFERFLNPERISMPDIDSDIANQTRGKVIEYVQNKYGEMAVCAIMTTTSQAPKGSVRIASKFYGLSKYGEPMTSLGNALATDIPSDVGVSFATKVSEAGKVDDGGIPLYDYLMSRYGRNNDAKEIIRWSKIIEGAFTAYGAHAAGIVISDNDDVSDYIPLKMNEELGMFTTQCDMVQVEDNGLLKFDFLGLQTLDIITGALRMIEDDYGIIIDPLKIDLEDADVYSEILAAGKTNSVFQFESDGMKAMLKRFKPDCFEDLIILVSMFRPGPLQYLDGVIDVKNGVSPIEYLTPELEPILGRTYGAIVYQEQVMEICQKLAGFTLGHADQVRRFMSKKKADKLAHEREAFVSGCTENGIAKDISNTLFDQMMDFASYAFNKSHAAAYAYNAYITAWLKYHYPVEFFASALNWTDNKKLSGLMYEASMCGVKILPPDINRSERNFSITDGKVLFSLSSIAGVKNQADEIIAERQNGPYTSIIDFCSRVRLNGKAVEHIISAGALDSFGENRSAMKLMVEDMKELISKQEKKASFIRSAEALLPVIEKLDDNAAVIDYQIERELKAEIKEITSADKLEKRISNAKDALTLIKNELDGITMPDIKEDKAERMTLEKQYLGNYITEHPMDFYPKAEEVGSRMAMAVDAYSDSAYGVITNLTIKGRKSDGAKMAFFSLEDRSGSIEVAMFTKAYSYYGKLLKEDGVIKVYGSCDVQEDQNGDMTLKFFADKAEVIGQKKATIILNVPSFASFHIDSEDAFKAKYQDAKGHPFIIYDKAMDEMREMNYRISAKALALPDIEEA